MRLHSVLHRGSRSEEVRQIQELLNLAESRPRLKADGVYGDETVRSVRYFQSTHSIGVDGRVGNETLSALERATRNATTTQARNPPTPAPAETPTNTGTTTTGAFCFPLAFRPSPDWKGGSRYFGAPRDGGRLHAGCDLLGPQGSTIYAVADGVARGGEYTFTTRGRWSATTHAIEIRHGDIIVRYGEIQPGSYIGGRTVKKGDAIAKIGGLQMLHLEVYKNGSDPGTLTGSNAYHRRRDVTNPSPYLDQWIHNMPR